MTFYCQLYSISKSVWSLQSAPDASKLQDLIESMKHRVEIEEIHKCLNATEYEKNSKHFERFLNLHFYDQEVAMNRWNGWVSWRHGNTFVD
jgi:hypothetical protein